GRLAAYAVQVTAPGARPTSGGTFLLDAATGVTRSLALAQGAEQFPVSWSPDGASLLMGSVLAMGACSFSIVDVSTGATTPLPEDVRFCGVSGQVLGWTAIR